MTPVWGILHRDVNSSKGMQVDVSMPGAATLFSGQPILLKDFRQGVDGLYFIQRIVHRMGRGGFTSSFTAFQSYEEGRKEETVKKKPSKGDGFDGWEDGRGPGD